MRQRRFPGLTTWARSAVASTVTASPLALVAGLAATAAASLGLSACGGDDEPPPPAQVSSFAYAYSATAPCDAVLPRPNDVFVDDDLRSAAGGCGLPADPIEAAIARVMADEGAPVSGKLVLPVEGLALQGDSLTASVAFSLARTSSVVAAGELPPFVLFEQVGSATIASGWRTVAVTAAVTASGVEVTPSAPLAPARRHVLIATTEIRNSAAGRVDPAPQTELLVGTTPIAAGAAEGLDAAGAAALERERLRLAPLVGLLARAMPPIPAASIAAIQGFTTQLGSQRLAREVAAYQAAAARDRFSFAVTVEGGDLTPASVDSRTVAVCPVGRAGVGCYDRVRAFRRGTIRVPKLLDAEGHLRAGWSTTAIETVEVPFMASIPTTIPAGGAQVAVLLPGFARGRIDVREIANEYAGRLNAIALAVELDRHGERTVDPATGMPDLTDVRSNGIVDFAANLPDGVPDKSGAGFFRGEPRAARDAQIAAVIETLHVLEALRRRTAFVQAGLEVDGRTVNLIGHGHSAHIALHVAAYAGNLRTLSLPAGGAGVRELVAGGPELLKSGFLASAPPGVSAANLDAYLARLEETVLTGVSVDASADLAYDKLVRPNRQAPRILLPHGEAARVVPTAARARLIAALELPTSRVSEHHGQCDDFFLFVCSSGDLFAWVAGAVNQMSTFASSGGVTVSAPAP